MENWDLSFAAFLSSFWLLDLAENTTQSMQVPQRLYEASHVMGNKHANGFNLYVCVYGKISSPSIYINTSLNSCQTTPDQKSFHVILAFNYQPVF